MAKPFSGRWQSLRRKLAFRADFAENIADPPSGGPTQPKTSKPNSLSPYLIKMLVVLLINQKDYIHYITKHLCGKFFALFAYFAGRHNQRLIFLRALMPLSSACCFLYFDIHHSLFGTRYSFLSLCLATPLRFASLAPTSPPCLLSQTAKGGGGLFSLPFQFFSVIFCE